MVVSTYLFDFFKIGFVNKSVDVKNNHVLERCTNFMKKISAADLLKVSTSWPDDTNIMSPLFDTQLLAPSSYSSNNYWITSEEKVSLPSVWIISKGGA